MHLRSALALALCLLLVIPVQAEETIPADVLDKFRKEAKDNSKILDTLHYFTDRYGPRLTGSPNHKAAADWAVKRLTGWGLSNAHLEAWDFGHPGWANERFTGHFVAPVKDALVAEVLAWTPGTNGVVTAEAVALEIPAQPTQEALAQFFEANKARVAGKIVLAGKPAAVTVNFQPPAKRRDDETLRKMLDPNAPPQQRGPGGPRGPDAAKAKPGAISAQMLNQKLDEFLLAAGALVRVNDAGRDHGQIRAFHNRTFDIAKALPTVVLRNEDYGRAWRLIEHGQKVEMSFDIVNKTYPEGKTSYNVIAEIPGSDKKDEVVMLGGHLDSWHAATGATDNAIGCSMMMEAVRILVAAGVKPRRTIRIALWSGEEQGLLGSQAYVKQHFGSAEEPKPGFEKFAGYFNIDSGTGRPRMATIFGPPEGAQILRSALDPLADLGFMGATATSSRRRGGSDHTSFNEAGLPGIGLGQDPIEYNSHTWHTNLDTYERIVLDDVVKGATVIAAGVYHLAMRDEMLPRFSKDKMPPKPAPPANPGEVPVTPPQQ